MDELARHAAALREAGSGFAATGARVNATWQGLGGVYEAPEVGQLLAATAPVQTVSAAVSADIGAVAGALAAYAAEVRQIQAELEALRGHAQAFVDTNSGNDDWKHDDGKVDQNNQLISAVDAQVATFYEAQRRCANAISALYGGPQYRADNGDGRLTDGEYGYTARELDSAAGQDGALPWGSTQEHDRGLLGDIGAFWCGFGQGMADFVTGLGALIGRDPTTGEWSWGTAGSAWKGLGTFALAIGVYLTPGGMQLDQSVGVPGMKRGQLGDTLLTAGKSLIAYDEWGKDKSRAAGMATFNVVSAVLGTKGAGAGLRGAGAVAEGSRIAAVSKAGTLMVRGGGAIGKLPTVTDLAKGVANRFPALRLPSFGATAHVDVPHHVDTPTVHTPHSELPTTPSPSTVGAALHHTPSTAHIPDAPASAPPALAHHTDSPAPHQPETSTPTQAADTAAPHHADPRGPDSPTPSHPTGTREPQHPAQHIDPPPAHNADPQHPTPLRDASTPNHANPQELTASRPDLSADAPTHSPEASTNHPATPHDTATPTHSHTSTHPVRTSASHPHPASDASSAGNANAHEHAPAGPSHDGTPHDPLPHDPASPDHSEHHPTPPAGQGHLRSPLADAGGAADALPPHDQALLRSIQHHADRTSPPGLDTDHGDPAHVHTPEVSGGLPDIDHLSPAEAGRAALEQMRGDWPELDRVLTDNPVASASLLSHPDSVKMLDAALRDVKERLDDAGIIDTVRRGPITPEIQAKVDSIINDLRAEDPNQVLDKPQQLAISREIAAGTTRDGYRQSGFDLSRREDPAYQEECVDRLRTEAPQAQERLNRIVSDIASDNGGEASWRPQVKDRGRALDKVREYVESFPDGDASMLVDVVGAKIRFGSVDELYRALEGLKNDPRLDIVRIKDRVAEATKSGNRSILMNARLADGQVAELKFGLKSFEAPAAAEHPLYEVRRDLDSIALAERRPSTPVESLIKAVTEAHARREYGAAWNREMAGSRLHEILTDHADVASIAQRLVADAVTHPTNLAKALTDPATRDATIDAIGELADGRVLSGQTLGEYRAAHPGAGPLFEPVDPSINLSVDGRYRKTVFLDEAKRADPARNIGSAPTAEESAQLTDYARRLRENVHPAVEAELRRFVTQAGNDSAISVRTKSADSILDKVERMTTGSPSRPPRPDYRAGDVIDAVGARITTSDMHGLAQIHEAAKSHFGVGDRGRIMEIENMYASPKEKNPAYRVVPLVVRVDVDGLPYTFELQLTTRRASIAADLEHNTLFKPYVEMSPTDEEIVRRMLAEAAALDQEETRWTH